MTALHCTLFSRDRSADSAFLQIYYRSLAGDIVTTEDDEHNKSDQNLNILEAMAKNEETVHSEENDHNISNQNLSIQGSVVKNKEIDDSEKLYNENEETDRLITSKLKILENIYMTL